MKIKKIAPAFLCLAVLAPLALGAATITYQARVRTSGGADVNGPVTVGFRIYDGATTVSPLWGETQSLIADKGVVNVQLGSVKPLPPDLFNHPDLFIGITVAGDTEMTPRTRLLSTWKAMSAGRASGKRVQAGGATLTVSGASTASAPITFPQAFSAPPVVMVGAPRDAVGGVYFISARVTEVTAAGCTVHFSSLGGAPATGSAEFDWIAVGE